MIKTPDIDNILLLCHAKQNECSLLHIQHGNFVPLDWGFTYTTILEETQEVKKKKKKAFQK